MSAAAEPVYIQQGGVHNDSWGHRYLASPFDLSSNPLQKRSPTTGFSESPDPPPLMVAFLSNKVLINLA